MEKREIDLTVSCYGKVKDVEYDVVILPWELRNPIICIFRILLIVFCPMI